MRIEAFFITTKNQYFIGQKMPVYKAQMTIMTGCALDEDKYYVSVINDEIDFEIECCQMVLYDFKSDSWQENHNNMDWRAESGSMK